jgi:hypothetical protein
MCASYERQTRKLMGKAAVVLPGRSLAIFFQKKERLTFASDDRCATRNHFDPLRHYSLRRPLRGMLVRLRNRLQDRFHHFPASVLHPVGYRRRAPQSSSYPPTIYMGGAPFAQAGYSVTIAGCPSGIEANERIGHVPSSWPQEFFLVCIKQKCSLSPGADKTQLPHGRYEL